MQPSPYEIEREVEALRDLRRRSSSPGGLAIDPDLPITASPISPNGVEIAPVPSDGEQGDDPLHLFWVPADVHPELAPAEFRAFLKEHSRTPGQPELARSSSLSTSSGLGRKKSMLSKQYSPSENDNLEHEHVVPLRRNRSSMYANQGPQLTINDLQKLEELAEEASESNDATRLRSILRRSLSMNVSPSAAEKMDDVPQTGEEADSPIIVPPPGLILRRAARTKIRKAGLPGDGGGHRFGASRRGPGGARAQTTGPESTLERRASDVSSSDNGDSDSGSHEAWPLPVPRARTISSSAVMERPDSFSDVYDAYAATDEDEDSVHLVSSAPPEHNIFTTEPLPHSRISQEEPAMSAAVQSDLLAALGPIIHQPQPQLQLASPARGPSRTPSPGEPLALHREPSPATSTTSFSSQEPSFTPHLPSSYLPPSALNASQQQAHARKEKEKEKKGLFGVKAKRGSKEKERESRSTETKGSGFFGGLFGGKKKHEEAQPVSSAHGRETAQALLGVSKTRSRAPSPAPPGSPLPGSGDNWSRFPIHVERAIYRLSHIKLANPRRPLYEQVLISNLMFWYLGVINNKAANTTAATETQSEGESDTEAEAAETKEREREAKEREEQAQQRAEQERQEKERESRKKEPGKRGSLTKTPPGTAPSGSRRSEVPVKGPSYELQHREMQQEYGGYQVQQVQPYHGGHSQYAGAPQLGSPEPQAEMQLPDQFYYSSDPQQQRANLPPGAMAPIDTSHWLNQRSEDSYARSSSTSPPTSPGSHRARSPPNSAHASYGGYTQDMNTPQHRGPSRSVSATAVPTVSPPISNGKLRKGQSAHAVAQQHHGAADHRRGRDEEEDVPLAVWQQQRRR